MAATIIHVGTDACHRISVLENAGYTVLECTTAAELREALVSDQPPAALVITDEQGRLSAKAIELAHAHGDLPVILFGEPQRSLSKTRFRLVIPNLAPPQAWLTSIATVVTPQ